MSNGVSVSGLPQIRKSIEEIRARFLLQSRKAIRDIGDIALGNAVDRAPIDEGILAESIERYLYDDAAGVHVSIRVPSNAPAAAYAAAMHEGKYKLGENSERKQRRLGVTVGRRYIVRGVEDGIEDYNIIIKDMLRV